MSGEINPDEILRLNHEIERLKKIAEKKEAEREILVKQASEREQFLRSKGFDVDNLDQTIANLSMEVQSNVQQVKEKLKSLGVI